MSERMVFCWRQASVPANVDNAEGMVWFKPGDDMRETAMKLAQRHKSRRCLFIRHFEKHTPQAWPDDVVERFAKGADPGPGRDYWRAFWQACTAAGVKGCRLVVVEYEDQWHIGWYQIGQAQAMQLSAEAANKSNGQLLPAGNVRSYSSHLWGQIARWITETVAEPYEAEFDEPCMIGNYGFSAYSLLDPNLNAEPDVTMPVSMPVCYVRPNKGTRRQFAQHNGLVVRQQAGWVDSYAWASPRYQGKKVVPYAEIDLASRLMLHQIGQSGVLGAIHWSSELELAERSAKAGRVGESVVRAALEAERESVRALAEAIG